VDLSAPNGVKARVLWRDGNHISGRATRTPVRRVKWLPGFRFFCFFGGGNSSPIETPSRQVPTHKPRPPRRIGSLRVQRIGRSKIFDLRVAITAESHPTASSRVPRCVRYRPYRLHADCLGPQRHTLWAPHRGLYAWTAKWLRTTR